MSKLVINVDGASRGNPGDAGIGFVIRNAEGEAIKTVSDYLGKTTNNVAEYTALVRALEESLKSGGKEVEVRSDSELVVKQVRGEYRVRNSGLIPLYREVRGLIEKIEQFSIVHVPREENAEADRLANEGIDEALNGK